MIIILSSPSGAGKTTLTRLLSEKNKNLDIQQIKVKNPRRILMKASNLYDTHLGQKNLPYRYLLNAFFGHPKALFLRNE